MKRKPANQPMPKLLATLLSIPEDFWPLIRLAADFDRQMCINEAYFEAGYCGGCETCGEMPYPQARARMVDTYLRIAALFNITTPAPHKCEQLMSYKKKKRAE
jgi:hypothetical protein